MEMIYKALLLGVAVLAVVLLLGPFEAYLEGAMAFVIFAAVVVGFLIYPRREVFYVRTTIRLIQPDGNRVSERDLLAVRVEVARLWLLFLPTSLAVAFLVFFAAGGPTKFSFLNWIFLSRFAFVATTFSIYPPLLVLVLVSAWVSERRVMRDAEACSARSFTLSHSGIERSARVSYLFMGEHGEYYAGDCMYVGLVHPQELATIVFHNVRKPELNKIAMGFLFHRLIVLGRGVTELDKQTAAAQRALAETASLSLSPIRCGAIYRFRELRIGRPINPANEACRAATRLDEPEESLSIGTPRAVQRSAALDHSGRAEGQMA